MEYFNAFWVGGLICAIGQILIDKTKLTPARILVSFVCAGVLLTLVGIYKPLVEFAGAGATVPITGFGYALYNGVVKAIGEKGIQGILSGGLMSVAGGVSAAILFSFLAAVIFKPKMK
ncbi:MAG: stage V sporulation protein AE [Ruminococcaceae bacterium]|nr:stage V sporulation protein AE [Oscillospiraceae bacterium]